MVSSAFPKPAVELRHLQSFLAVAESMSFSKAAEHLGVSQPPLSRQIQRLEAKLNVQLFDRSHSQVRLTEAGRIFAESARRIMDQMEQGIHDAQRVAQGLTGELVVGLDSSALACGDVMTFVVAYQERFPQLSIQVKELAAQAQVKALLAHEISVGFVEPWRMNGLPVSAEVVTRSVVKDRLSIVLPAFHPLATLNQPNSGNIACLSLNDLENENFVMDEAWQQYVCDFVQQQHGFVFAPQIVQSATERRLVLSMVALGRGLAMLPSATEAALPFPNVIYRLIQPAIAVDTLSVIWRQDETRPVVHALTQALLQTGIR